jgi:hypothetical protein
VKKGLVHSLRKCSQIPKNSQTLDFDSYGQYKGSHGESNPSEIGCFLIQTHAEPSYSQDIAPSDVFLFDWLKIQLEGREYNGKDELFEVVDEILTGLSIEMIGTVFVDWMNRLQHLFDGNGGYVS